MEYKFTNIEQIEVIEDSIKTLNDLEELSVGVGNTVFHSDSSGIWLGANKFSNAPFSVTMEGILKGKGAIIEGTIKTSDGSTRIEMNGTENEFRVYKSGILVASMGVFDGADGEVFNISFDSTASGAPVRMQGYVDNSSVVYIKNDSATSNARALTVSSPTASTSGALYVRNGYSTSLASGKAAVFQNSGDGSNAAVEIYGGYGGVYNGVALKLYGSLITGNVYPSADNTYYLGNSNYKYAGLYVSSSVSTGYAGSVGGGGTTSGDSNELTSGPGNLFAGHTHTIPAHTHAIPMHSHTINFNTVTLTINGTTRQFLVV